MRGLKLIVTAAAMLTVACAGTSKQQAGKVPERPAAEFKEWTGEFVRDLMAFYPEWAVQVGKYDGAERVTIPDAAWRASELAFLQHEQRELAAFDPAKLEPLQRADWVQIDNFIRGMQWERGTLREWEWNPALQQYPINYNPAGPLDVLLNTEYAPLDQRLRSVSARLQQVPTLYAAVQANLKRPVREHTQLAIAQHKGVLQLLGEDLAKKVTGSGLNAQEQAQLNDRIKAARAAVEGYVAHLTEIESSLTPDYSRSFRLGKEFYGPKFGYDIQSAFTPEQLYERAVAAKEKLHVDMEAHAKQLWPKYFRKKPMPKDRAELIATVVNKVSETHSKPEKFIDDVRAQIPALEKFVREKNLLEQDPSKPLVVRETPPYSPTRGVAIASIDAPGPFNPGAPTYYNVNPMSDFTPERQQSFLREYNSRMMQILNIHEAVPGHYTQLLHSNKSPSVVKSLLGSGPMIEGWACYVQRMMLESGWGKGEPELWLMLEKFELRAVANTILDYSVHVLDMSEEDALKLLMKEAFQTETEARGKWRRVQLTSVQLTSYFAGYTEIYDFREAQKLAQGGQFDLGAFHNRFLSFGSVPVKTIRGLMGEPTTAVAGN